MSIYALQVRTGCEERYMKLFCSAAREKDGLRLHFPQRTLKERRQGRMVTRNVPVFPSYLFTEVNNDDNITNYKHYFNEIAGFFRFLPSNRSVFPLQGEDLETVAHFIFQDNDTAGVSKVYFNEKDRIVIKEGPLLGLEGRIIKIDRRKSRAKVKLDIYNNSFAIDLAFDVINGV